MIDVIIVAAGKGERMKADMPKQYLDLGGRPILGHVLAAFDEADAIDRMVLALPAGDIDFCRKTILPPLNLKKTPRLISGGARRQDSTLKGIAAAPNPGGIVLIHDGARPFIQPLDIAACIRGAQTHGACALGRPCSDTVKKTSRLGVIEKTLDRNSLWMAQTPQAFRYEIIKTACEAARKDGFEATDEASVVERMGIPVKMVKSSGLNMKITEPGDLFLARAIFNAGQSAV